MSQPNFRRVQPKQRGRRKNPYELTIKQHTHSAHALKKFSDEAGKVEVMLFPSKTIEKKRPNDSFFCAMRLWDERAEKGYMATIEERFHKEIDDPFRPAIFRGHEAITEYFFLWMYRHACYHSSHEDIHVKGISGGNYTHDEEEILEKKFTMFIQGDSTIPYHMMNGVQIQRRIDEALYKNKEIKWSLWKAARGEFILSDCYFSHTENWGFMPITPKLAFVASSSDSVISFERVKELNRKSMSLAKRYCLARDWTKTPI